MVNEKIFLSAYTHIGTHKFRYSIKFFGNLNITIRCTNKCFIKIKQFNNCYHNIML